jgi:protein-tyrosine phosphatase
MDENFATFVVNNKAIAALGVIEFHDARRHGFPTPSLPRANRDKQLSYAVADIRKLSSSLFRRFVMLTARPMNTVLFLCTGNYYRSRFAEELFNHKAAAIRPVVRFQHSHPVSVGSHANVGIKGPLANISGSGALDLTFASGDGGLGVANVKSAPLRWQAQSRALAIERGVANIGPLSPFALQALRARGCSPTGGDRMPRQCADIDFENAQRIIALNEREHRPLIRERFPEWEQRVDFWQVEDVSFVRPDVALAAIEKHVDGLFGVLRGSAE